MKLISKILKSMMSNLTPQNLLLKNKLFEMTKEFKEFKF